MPYAYIARPHTVLGEHLVTREEMTADVVARHVGHPRMGVINRVLAKSPSTRRFSQPLDVVLSERPFEERNETAVADVLQMATKACRAALEATGTAPADVDCVITTSSTTDWLPGLDVHLIGELGLRPTVSRVPMSQLGCGGGAHALVKAVHYVRAHPGTRVLVVGGESLSSLHHHGDDRIEHFIYKLLWGDSSVATVVSDVPSGPGLAVEETWEHVLPGSTARYRKRTDRQGVHFDSEKSAPQSVNDTAPALREWLAGWPLDFVVPHAGGVSILDDLQRELKLTDAQLVHARQSLDEDGNLGGPSVLRVLERTYATPPADGEQGLLLGFGPGFTTAALRVRWAA
ncbi:3-oxoacyl-[acyl-carrier-protein] synthase III C-terminal domain-containing protein [Kitasatospora sp. NPDC058478]|uniref:3-oxoacyl-[acyl-carrier-protein] synthase III C-terminal domain-containing protein n=1 Tax=unclassified Kitasatospora TaxID=2633591 RepID=UPI00364895E0